MTDADNLYQAMIEAGLAMYKPTSILADGKVHRYRVAGDKAGSLNGWYVLHLEAKAFGAFGSWKTGQSCTWSAAKPETMTPAERQALAARMQEVRAAHAAETARFRPKRQSVPCGCGIDPSQPAMTIRTWSRNGCTPTASVICAGNW